MSPSLSVVADNDLKIAAPAPSPAPAPIRTESVAERVRRLQAEAKQLAKDHIRSLSAQLVAVEELAAEIAEGGEAYPPGVRDLARRLVEDMDARVQTLEAIVART
ncbi:hypothetical protein [Phenylobacterium sp.]|uniref:hypothetical protein n=1 Tax=Phenylobacterium sp. TaxID=1871053 RepID=UPI00391DB3FE